MPRKLWAWSTAGRLKDGKPFARNEYTQSDGQALHNQLSTWNHLLFTHANAPKPDTAFWTNFDLDKSITAAMDDADMLHSGKHDFVDTLMYQPITHMVAPADQTQDGKACHAEDGRMATVSGVYVPGSGTGPGGQVRFALLLALRSVTLVASGLRIAGFSEALPFGLAFLIHVGAMLQLRGTVGGSFRAHVKPTLKGFDKATLTPEEEAHLA